ncbi:putative arsenite inducuble rna associated protein aip-1 [Paragonimus heterotremus]|uniref:Putative arsenite inducuble rna associated protein aip-1 n=1 Tax=Paragonimus heterotremus TaxID=100268 RepID=A0A8J4SKY2_9TREM|nr:putative arsenite inducuble rna associated protein aip-1 [Paragonimus heterotremus]
MEFPEIGANCAFSDCRRLDFLPMKCAGCQGLFCKDHYVYSRHNCRNPGIQDKQVPICPLCNAIVPVRPGELPDERVGQHIDSACKSKPALELKGKIFPNACSVPKCKKREAVDLACARCGLNYCLSHRNELDHNCQGRQRNSINQRRISAAGAAAIFRAVFQNQQSARPKNNSAAPSSTNQTQPSSDEARALQEEEDRQLALALTASLVDSAPTPPRRSSQPRESSCAIS